jgi:hypothetical protein
MYQKSVPPYSLDIIVVLFPFQGPKKLRYRNNFQGTKLTVCQKSIPCTTGNIAVPAFGFFSPEHGNLDPYH